MPLIKRVVFYAPRGPIVHNNDPKLFDALIDAVRVEAVKMKGRILKIDPEIEVSNTGYVNMLLSPRVHK